MAILKGQNKSWIRLRESVIGKHADRVNAILTETEDDEEFLLNYFKLLEYVQPKLQRTEIQQESEDEITLKIEYVKSNADKEESKK